MKRFLQGLLVAGLIVLGLHTPSARASTITVNPNPTDSFNIGNTFSSPSLPVDDTYKFVLTKAATVDGIVNQYKTDLQFALFDDHNATVSFASTLHAGIDYVLHLTGNTTADPLGPYLYGGKMTFTAAVAATPLPPTLLLFVSALGGLGCMGFRRRHLTPIG